MSNNTWFINPKDAYTNETICKGIFPDGVDIVMGKVGDVELPMIPVSYANLRFLERSRISSHLSFDTYVRRGPNGPFERSPFVDGKLRSSLKNNISKKIVRASLMAS